MRKEILPANHWDEVGHFYSPIDFYNGAVLKYKGIATEGNKVWFVEETPGTIILAEYKGDRIKTADHSEHTTF